MVFGIALMYGEDRAQGLAMLSELRDTCVKERYAMNIVSALETVLARHSALEDLDSAIQRTRMALDELFASGNFVNCEGGTHNIVELLLARGTNGDVVEAETAIERLAAALPDSEWATRDVMLLRLRALLAQARGDEGTYRDYRDRYRLMAEELG